MISSENVWIPKYEEQILDERRKKIDTASIDKKVKNQENPSKMVRRFQTGDILSGYRENQYKGMYKAACAQIATVPRPW